MDARINIIADSRQVRTATQDLERLELQGKTTTAVTNQLRTAFAALGGALAVRELARLSDTYTGIQNRLRIVTDSTAQLAEVQGKLLQVANDSRAEFETTVELYSTLARSTEELGLSQDRLLRVTETINKAFAASGADAQTAAGAIRQLGQGLASGALRGDEFNSVAEGAPEIMRAIAVETGMTIGALREFAAEGKITSELLIRSLENYGDTVDDIFRNSERTIAQSFQEARNNAIQFVGGIEAVDDAAQAFGDSIVALSENLDLVVDAATVLAAVFAGRMAGAIWSNVAAFTAAQIQAVRYQATLASMAGVSRTTAVALTAMGVAARGASAAMAFLGGPVGVALLAAGAVAYFAMRTDEAIQPTQDLSAAVAELGTEYEKMTDAQRESAMTTIRARQAEIEDEIARLKGLRDLQQEVADFTPSERASLAKTLGISEEELQGSANAAIATQAAIDGLVQRSAALDEKLKDIAESGKQVKEEIDDVASATYKASGSFESLAASLTQQIIELRDGADAAEDFAIAQRLGADATDAERNAIAGLVGQLRELRAERELSRERERLGGAVTSMVNELSVGDDPVAQAEDRYFERLSIIDNAIAAEGQILDEHRTAMILAEQAYQDELTRISAEAERIRTQQAEQEAQARRAATESMLAGLSGVFGNFAEIAKQGGEETFSAYKALASAQAAISAAVAINRALAEGGPFLGPALAVSIGLLTAAQIAQINNQKYSPRAVGGQVLAGNQYLVGERGPELITMGSNGNVTPYNQLMREARSTTNNNNNMTANITFTMPEGDADFRNRIADNRDLIYNIVADVLNDRGQRF